MRQHLVKFFYRELLRLQEYDKTVLLYTKGRAFAAAKDSKVDIVSSKITTTGPDGDYEFPGHQEISIDIPVVMTFDGYDHFLNELGYAFKNQDLTIRYTEGDGEEYFECESLPTSFVVPALNEIPKLELTAMVKRLDYIK
ncbi:MAG TPA: hypothetical protein VD884_13295 [Ohtaekwangia sp.]|nr:hypothetical protein [Ohtaekwangia sp.]